MPDLLTLSEPAIAGTFGPYGGRFVPEVLSRPLEDLAVAYAEAVADPAFHAELGALLAHYTGRPTPLDLAPRLSDRVGVPVLLKREDLNHTGAHKINNTLGQILLARRMGKRRIIAETGAGQHGVATAAAAARFGIACEIHMGEEDMRRQRLNVRRMELMGARVIPARTGSRTLKDAVNEAIRDWVAHAEDTFYLIGSVVGPDPYPRMVRDFQSVIGREARAQCLAQLGRLPAQGVACIGGGSNAMGLFHAFLGDAEVDLVGVEAAGAGLETDRHAATLTLGRPGVLHGSYSYLLQDDEGQVMEAHSISAGLDYPGVGPEHAFLKDTGRVRYTSATDAEALAAFELLSRLEGIIPAFESSHALAQVLRDAGRLPGPVLVCLSGRGDKDLEEYLLRRGATEERDAPRLYC
ncbi:MAG TPA: tryptophan synthase subunit beta [Holophaga sp.]|nr:tryptophan synthase subunit beta [Holophaga sp.]